MQNRSWLAALRNRIASHLHSPFAVHGAPAAIRRRRRNAAIQLPVSLELGPALLSGAESLEDRTLLSVTADLSAGVLTVTLTADADHAYISFNGGLKVGTTAGGTNAFDGTTAQTITSLSIVNGGSFTGQQVTFSGTNTISGSNGTTATGLNSISIAAGIDTVNLQQVLNASTVTGSATTVNVASSGRLQTAVHLTASSGSTIAAAAADYTGEGTVEVSNKTVTVTGPQANVSPNSTPASWTNNSALARIARFSVLGTGGLTLNGLRLLGGAGGGDDDSAIIMLGSGGLDVSNCIISVAADSGKQGTGIDVGYASGNSAVTVTHCLFSGFTNSLTAPSNNGWGVYLNYDATATNRSVTITNNTFDMAGIINGLDGNVTGNPIGIDGYRSSALTGTLLIQNNQFRDTSPFYSIMVADFNGIVSADISLSGVSSNTFTNAAASPGTRDTDILYNLTSRLVTTGSNTVAGVTYASVIVDATNSGSSIDGTSDSNYISGQQLNDTISGLGGNDRLSGNSGNDTLSGGSGDDLLEGGPDTDTATFSGNYSAYSFSYSGTAGNYLLQVTGPDGTDTLTGIEILQFSGSTTTVRVAGFGAYASIAAALSAAASDSPDGEVILIEPGTYTGQTYSLPGNNMTLRGLGADNTRIEYTNNTAVSFSGRSGGTLAWLTVAGGVSSGVAAVVNPTTGSPTLDNALVADASAANTTITSSGSQTITLAYSGGPTVQLGSGPAISIPANKPLQVTGSAGADVIVLNFSGSNPIPQGLVFDGGAGDDGITITGGSFSTVVYTATTSNGTSGDGTLTLDGTSISFQNLEPIDYSGSSITNLTVNVDSTDSVNGNITTTLTANGANTEITFSPFFEGVILSTITGTLTINGDNTDPDTFTVASLAPHLPRRSPSTDRVARTQWPLERLLR